MNEILMSSEIDNYETPRWLFDELHKAFDFSLDAAADERNRLCSMYFTVKNSALNKPWIDNSRPDVCIMRKLTAYCNPPYSRSGLIRWFTKFKEETDNGWTIVALVPARTETKWFKIVWDYAKYVIFLYGRLKFTLNGQNVGTAPFPSAIPIFTNDDWDLTSLEKYGKIIKLR